jgi:ribosomal protein S18 acetylase RimI-like enzyme
MTIKVQRGGRDSLDAIEPLWKAMLEHHGVLTGDQFPMREPAESWSLRRAEYVGWLDDGSGILLLATSDSSADVAGYAFLRWRPAGATWDFGSVIGEVESLAVAPSARGGGVGTGLLDACRAELRARGVEFWSVDVVESNPAVRLYERAGFRPNYRKMFGRVDPPG